MVKLRAMTSADREQVHTILIRTGFFSEAEIEVAMELVDIFLARPGQKDYFVYVAESVGSAKNPSTGTQICGYLCFGPTPLTAGTYDLYWIAVHPEFQNQGIGKKMLTFLEQEVARLQGRLIIIETSSQNKYASTQAFYLHSGYQLAAQIKDFYQPGDDRMIYSKYIKN
jgi:ribosomal protein S18 acetylase RimI-like enzyme